MKKEKIKVSFLIDKEAVRCNLFDECESMAEFHELLPVIDEKEELLRDVTECQDETRRSVQTDFISTIALDMVLSLKEDSLLAKRLGKNNGSNREELKKREENPSDDTTITVKKLKLRKKQAEELLDSLNAMFGEDNTNDNNEQ